MIFDYLYVLLVNKIKVVCFKMFFFWRIVCICEKICSFIWLFNISLISVYLRLFVGSFRVIYWNLLDYVYVFDFVGMSLDFLFIWNFVLCIFSY